MEPGNRYRPAAIPARNRCVKQSSFATGTATDAIVSGTVTVPGGEMLNLAMDFRGDEDAPEIGIENGYDSPLDLDSARPDGTYTVQLVTQNQGTLEFPLSLVGGNDPPVPHVTNFDALQSADASAAITVQWAAMGGTASDFIQLTVSQLGGDGLIEFEILDNQDREVVWVDDHLLNGNT